MLVRPSTRQATIRLATILTLTLFVSGCGYRSLLPEPHPPSPTARAGDFDASEATGSAHATRLAVLALRNDSPEPGLDRVLTDSLRKEMDARSGLALVNDPSDAEWVLRGRVRPLLIQSRSFSSFVAALEYSVTVVLDLEVVRSGGNVIRLDPAMLSETDVYLASADIETTRTHRLEAIRRLSDLLASRIADSIEMMEQPIAISKDGE